MDASELILNLVQKGEIQNKDFFYEFDFRHCCHNFY